jgi:antitoxin (DNA-binding transcriptional repressor) of toxin-antitoxin stability system
MMPEKIPLTTFRASLAWVHNSVRNRGVEFVVTKNKSPVFKVVKVGDPKESEVTAAIATVTRNMQDFLDAIALNGEVILISHKKRLVRCVKV